MPSKTNAANTRRTSIEFATVRGWGRAAPPPLNFKTRKLFLRTSCCREDLLQMHRHPWQMDGAASRPLNRPLWSARLSLESPRPKPHPPSHLFEPGKLAFKSIVLSSLQPVPQESFELNSSCEHYVCKWGGGGVAPGPPPPPPTPTTFLDGVFCHTKCPLSSSVMLPKWLLPPTITHLLPKGTGPAAAAEGSYYVYTEAGLVRPILASNPAAVFWVLAGVNREGLQGSSTMLNVLSVPR